MTGDDVLVPWVDGPNGGVHFVDLCLALSSSQQQWYNKTVLPIELSITEEIFQPEVEQCF